MAKKVLIVDDSALVRKQLSEILEPLGFEIDTARNGQEGVQKAVATQYDVITMDINMPVMDGLEAVRQIMEQRVTPILMISSLTTEDAQVTMEALELGAVDYIAKPGTMNVGRRQNAEEIQEKVMALSRISPRRLKRQQRRVSQRVQNREVEEDFSNLSSKDLQKIVLIGSSTGGPGLIEQICSSLPKDYPHTVCVVQHMPEKFTGAFVERLNKASKIHVVESAKNMELLPSHVYIARGGVHMHFAKKVSGKIVITEELDKGSCYFQPSANEMMKSALKVFDPKKLVGVILTGIGDDGADAMVALKQAGAYTIAESEESATVYGMPKEAYERGGVMQQLDFKDIVKKIATLK